MFDLIDGKFIFKYGKENYAKAKEVANSCKYFYLDADEDELVTSTKFNSCYNCLFRKWTENSFSCLKNNRSI